MQRCPDCGNTKTYVVESRPTIYLGTFATRRRRWCKRCGARNTTYELLDATLESMGMPLTPPKFKKYDQGEVDPDYPDMAAVSVPCYWEKV